MIWDMIWCHVLVHYHSSLISFLNPSDILLSAAVDCTVSGAPYHCSGDLSMFWSVSMTIKLSQQCGGWCWSWAGQWHQYIGRIRSSAYRSQQGSAAAGGRNTDIDTVVNTQYSEKQVLSTWFLTLVCKDLHRWAVIKIFIIYYQTSWWRFCKCLNYIDIVIMVHQYSTDVKIEEA